MTYVAEYYMLIDWSSGVNMEVQLRLWYNKKETSGKNSNATRMPSYKRMAVCAVLCGYELAVTTDCVKNTIQISETMVVRHVDGVRLLGCQTDCKMTTREID
jgi:hypothetical protein